MSVFLIHAEIPEEETGESGSIDVSAFNEVYLTLRNTFVSGTSPTIDLQMEHSPDGTHWKSLCKENNQGLFRRLTSTGSDSITLTDFARFIRAAWTIGGTSPVFTFELTGVGK